MKGHAFLDDLNKLEETNRFYNWYHGYTKTYEPSTYLLKNGDYDIETSATSGSISTQYFGQKYQSHLVRKLAFPLVMIYPPQSACDNENITFHLKLEKVSITGLSLSNHHAYLIMFHKPEMLNLLISGVLPDILKLSSPSLKSKVQC